MKTQALQQAVYNVLNVSALTTLLSSAYSVPAIFSDVPQADDSEDDNYFPYVQIDDGTIVPFNTKDKLGGDATLQVDVFCRSTSKLAMKAVVDQVDALLNRQPLTIAGATHITTELQSITPTNDPDGRTVHFIMLYRVLWLDT